MCHMFVFRVAEKVHLLFVLGNGWASYLLISLFTMIGAIMVSLVLKRIEIKVSSVIEKQKSSEK